MRKGIKNVFEPWKEESATNVEKAWESDMIRTNNFGIHNMTRDKDDQERSLAGIKDKLHIIKVFQRFLMLDTKMFPHLSFDSIMNSVDKINEQYPTKFSKEKHKLTRA